MACAWLTVCFSLVLTTASAVSVTAAKTPASAEHCVDTKSCSTLPLSLEKFIVDVNGNDLQVKESKIGGAIYRTRVDWTE
jgi:hypothetical protein